MRKSMKTFITIAAASVLLGSQALPATAVATDSSGGRAPLGPCGTTQRINFTSTGLNGGTAKIHNCFSTSKRVAFRIHNVVFPISWDQTGACTTLQPGASKTMRNAVSSYAFTYVAC